MVEENLSQQFRLKNIDEIGNYFVEKIHQNELISAFTPLRGVLLGIASPAIDCAITAGIK